MSGRRLWPILLPPATQRRGFVAGHELGCICSGNGEVRQEIFERHFVAPTADVSQPTSRYDALSWPGRLPLEASVPHLAAATVAPFAIGGPCPSSTSRRMAISFGTAATGFRSSTSDWVS